MAASRAATPDLPGAPRAVGAGRGWMKENLLDVLLYLFENYIYEDPDAVRDRDSLQAGLLQAGFAPTEVTRAFDWLDELAGGDGDADIAVPGSLRVYADVEEMRLDPECRGFLLSLEQRGVLDPTRRELVIDRVMALDSPEFDVDDLKWVVLMVLFTQPGQEAAFAWMESHMFDDGDELPH
jgi:Smg protein